MLFEEGVFTLNLDKDISIHRKPTLCHWDYKYNNIILNTTEPHIQGIIDWENPVAATSLYNAIKAERNLITRYQQDELSIQQSESLKHTFRDVYTTHVQTEIDLNSPETKKEINFYQFYIILSALNSFGLWFDEFSEEEKNQAEQYYRQRLNQIYTTILSH